MPHYVIKPKKNGSDDPALKPRIVDAKNQARALAFVVEDTLQVALAEPADFMALAKAGNEIEKAAE
jgi:hypothetical protein